MSKIFQRLLLNGIEEAKPLKIVNLGFEENTRQSINVIELSIKLK
jgi:hypothetical protein